MNEKCCSIWNVLTLRSLDLSVGIMCTRGLRGCFLAGVDGRLCINQDHALSKNEQGGRNASVSRTTCEFPPFSWYSCFMNCHCPGKLRSVPTLKNFRLLVHAGEENEEACIAGLKHTPKLHGYAWKHAYKVMLVVTSNSLSTSRSSIVRSNFQNYPRTQSVLYQYRFISVTLMATYFLVVVAWGLIQAKGGMLSKAPGGWVCRLQMFHQF